MGMVHFFEVFLIARYNSFNAASSFWNDRLVFSDFLRDMLIDSMFVVYMAFLM